MGIKKYLSSLVSPTSKDKDQARREFILNVLLVGSLVLVLVAFIHSLITHLLSLESLDAFTPTMILVIASFFAFLLFLSKKGKSYLSATLMLGIYYLIPVFTVYTWGVEVPQAIVSFALLVVMGGILINAGSAFIIAFFSGFILIFSKILESQRIHQPIRDWSQLPSTLGDTILLATTLAVIAVVSWLFNREMEKSLKRARESEAALKRERDLLEIKVEERTRELKQAQMEKVAQLYRFAEFGRLTSGLLHDLVNPLNLVSLNLERLSAQKKGELVNIKGPLERAISGTKRLERFIAAAKKQIQNQNIDQDFSLTAEIGDAISTLSFRAKESGVNLNFISDSDIKVYGNPTRFNQLVTNIISNAIDAYEGKKPGEKEPQVEIKFTRVDDFIELVVQDWGVGIQKENLEKIFEPFFTTKSYNKGTGIGLSICRDIVENSFKGTMTVQSHEGEGTTFTIKFPLGK